MQKLFLTISLLYCTLSTILLGQDRLRILGIGNSFTLDLMYLVPNFLEQDTSKIELAFLFKSSGTLDDHLKNLREDKPEYLYYHYNNNCQRWDTATTTLHNILRGEAWDYIVLHQASFHAGVYSTIKNPLKAISDTLLHLQPQAKLAWQLTWAYAKDAKLKEFSIYNNSQQQMIYKIAEAAAQIIRDSTHYHIPKLIPSGVVIQGLRESDIEDSGKDFCIDGRHIDPQIGRYALTCTFYQSLLSQELGRSVLERSWHPENDTIHSESDYELVRQLAFKYCNDIESIWNDYATDKIYKADYFSIRGRRLYHLDGLSTFIEYDYYESGKKQGRVIMLKE